MIEEMKGMVVPDNPGRRVFRCTECDEVFAEEPWPRGHTDEPQECWMCGTTDDLDDDDQKEDAEGGADDSQS